MNIKNYVCSCKVTENSKLNEKRKIINLKKYIKI